MARRKKNPDSKTLYIALAAVGGIAAVYYFSSKASAATPGGYKALGDGAGTGTGSGSGTGTGSGSGTGTGTGTGGGGTGGRGSSSVPGVTSIAKRVTVDTDSASTINVRSVPSTSGRVIGTLARGAGVEVDGQTIDGGSVERKDKGSSLEWYRVKSNQGWISSLYTREDTENGGIGSGDSTDTVTIKAYQGRIGQMFKSINDYLAGMPEDIAALSLVAPAVNGLWDDKTQRASDAFIRLFDKTSDAINQDQEALASYTNELNSFRFIKALLLEVRGAATKKGAALSKPEVEKALATACGKYNAAGRNVSTADHWAFVMAPAVKTERFKAYCTR